MEAKGAQHLLRFWLEADMFNRSSQVLRSGSHVKQRFVKTRDPLQADPLSPCDEPLEAVDEDSPRGAQVSAPIYADSIGQDALHIYEKFLGPSAAQEILLEPQTLEEVISCLSKEHVDGNCFSKAQQAVFDQMDKQYYTEFLRSPFYTQRQIDILTTSNMASGPGLVDILANDGCLFYLMEFGEQVGVRRLIDFLIVADNFSTHTGAVDAFAAQEAQKDAMVIYDKFFSLQAETSLGFSDSLRSEIEESICSEDGPNPNTFALPFAIVVRYLENEFLQAFFNSALYQKYLTECIQTVQKSSLRPGGYHRAEEKDASSCSDTSSSITQQLHSPRTAGGSVSSDHFVAGSSYSDLIEDKHVSGAFQRLPGRAAIPRLQLLHVDPLGKLTSEFEPEPEGAVGATSTISKLKKLVGRSDRVEEEEQAWEAAHQMIREVQCLTTANNNNIPP
ncbi:A-kinase anchor protein 10, mitochondrial [Galendromus occidentalis]|uniref:A-kinase anchor protein 10, mitochondrial n=1 Tax=Galendromus occidentalis TaxID=34638 RepID=A0AAJ6QPP2_9ACAR|nr:A-kinase anchor protein 10, mitochondrial [Galendromus occidentalis]